MKPESKFRAARAVAQHCAELVAPPAAAEDLTALVQEFGQAAAKALAGPLSMLLGAEKLTVRCTKVDRAGASHVVADGQQPSAHFLLAEDGGPAAFAASIGGQDALAMCDRAFGGSGTAPDPLPDPLPMSTDLILKRIGTALAEAIANGFGNGRRMTLAARDHRLVKLIPFGRIAECSVINLTIADNPSGDETAGDTQEWNIRLLADAAALTSWLKAGGSRSATRSGAAGPGDPCRAPFAEIPLPVRAILAELRLPVSRVSDLQPGQTIPLPMRREVPLRIGAVDIATGSVGTLDDHMALRICGAETFTKLDHGDHAS